MGKKNGKMSFEPREVTIEEYFNAGHNMDALKIDFNNRERSQAELAKAYNECKEKAVQEFGRDFKFNPDDFEVQITCKELHDEFVDEDEIYDIAHERFAGDEGCLDYDSRLEDYMLEGFNREGAVLDKPILHYIGEETDGKKVKIPDGIKSMDYMFHDSGIKYQPEIPDTVESMRGTFRDCKSLTSTKDMPDSVRDCYETYRGCSELIAANGKVSDKASDYTNMFRDCTNLKTAPDIHMDSVPEDKRGWMSRSVFSGCKNLENMPDGFKPVNNQVDALKELGIDDKSDAESKDDITAAD